ncbi:hypothetical protein PQX77_005286 [Marasmius sp. AFHP31]|nr:hypothetical protein PQX77_005286 [Marasmius sp. AFHP31]
MLLPNGRYTIKSGDGNRPLGVDEDRIVVLSEGDSAPEWVFERVDSRFRIKTSDDKCVIPGDQKLWGKGEKDAKWKLEEAFHHGKNCFIIHAENGYEGWVTPYADEADNQMINRPLIVGPSYPPFFPPFERFIIERVKE